MINITENNCNYYLKKLYKENELIGTRIDKAIATGQLDFADELQKEYENNHDLISELIAFRNDHDCLIEGDSGYGAL